MGVQLAALDARVEGELPPPAWLHDHLGGAPAWPHGTPPPAALRQCVHCTAPLVLLLQLYVPPTTAAPPRLLFVLACTRLACPQRRPGASPLRVLRVTLAYETEEPDVDDSAMDTEAEANATPVDAMASLSLSATATADDWGAGTAANDWGVASAGDDWGAPRGSTGMESAWGTAGADLDARLAQREVDMAAAAEAEAAAAAAAREAAALAAHEAAVAASRAALMAPRADPADVMPHAAFDGWYLYFQAEPETAVASDDEDEGGNDEHVAALLEQYTRQGGTVGQAHASDLQEGMGRIEQEQYEEAVAAHGDSVFYKLQKRLARMPTQVLRYDRYGRPLAVTSQQPAPPPAPPCEHCGAPRAFEMQLLPRLPADLRLRPELRDVMSAGVPATTAALFDPVEFATVLISTCTHDCRASTAGAVLYAEEHAGVQADPGAVDVFRRARPGAMLD